MECTYVVWLFGGSIDGCGGNLNTYREVMNCETWDNVSRRYETPQKTCFVRYRLGLAPEKVSSKGGRHTMFLRQNLDIKHVNSEKKNKNGEKDNRTEWTMFWPCKDMRRNQC